MHKEFQLGSKPICVRNALAYDQSQFSGRRSANPVKYATSSISISFYIHKINKIVSKRQRSLFERKENMCARSYFGLNCFSDKRINALSVVCNGLSVSLEWHNLPGITIIISSLDPVRHPGINRNKVVDARGLLCRLKHVVNDVRWFTIDSRNGNCRGWGEFDCG